MKPQIKIFLLSYDLFPYVDETKVGTAILFFSEHKYINIYILNKHMAFNNALNVKVTLYECYTIKIKL